jgi:uridine kinase
MKTDGPFVVVIAGGTASGKSTIVSRFVAQTGATHLGHDRYYWDVPDPVGHDFDHPDALDTDRLVSDLEILRSGRPADLPVYDFASHTRTSRVERVDPGAIIVVEGILTLADLRLVALADLTVFVDAPEDVRFARRMARDVAERGRTEGSVRAQYVATVKPNHDRFVEPSRARAVLILDGTAGIDESVAALSARVAQ